MNNTQVINDWLLQRQIKVPMEWLEACIDWLRSENPGQANNLERLKSQVYEQWLMTDLSELGHATLPTEVKSEKYMLNGRYCLQINSVTDTSQSYYSQLLDLREQNQENTNVTAETQSTQFTQRVQNNSSRLLMMDLTDGCLQLHGMEYQHINCLNAKITPGTKIRVKGPILCRKGVLMLKGSNVELLGGEADSMSSNTPEAILCRALNLPVPTSTSAAEQNGVPEDAFEEEISSELLSELVESEFNHNSNSGGTTVTDRSSENHRETVTNGNSGHILSFPTPDFVTPTQRTTAAAAGDEFNDFDDDIDDIITSHDFLPEESIPPDSLNESTERKSLSYLCDIKLQNTAGRFIIKAFIMTLLSKLSSSSDGWELTGRICDGSDYLDVEFSNHFLTNLIGFTSNQANEIKSGLHPEQVKDLKTGMAKCRKSIIETCRIMEIEYHLNGLSTVVDVAAPQLDFFPYFS